MVYGLGTFILFLASSKEETGDAAPQNRNVILLRGQLAQGQGAWQDTAWPLGACVCFGVNLLTGAPNQRGRSQGTAIGFKQRVCCCPVFLRATLQLSEVRKSKRLSNQHTLKPPSTICHTFAKNTKALTEHINITLVP